MPFEVDLTPLLNPRSIAIVGASANLSRIGGVPLHLLSQSGFEPIYAVNPKYDRIGDILCFSTLGDIPKTVDLVVIATAARDVLNQLEQAHQKGVRAAVLFASGFAETGEAANISMQEAITAFAIQTGMLINGPNCLGIVNWKRKVFATFAKAFDPLLLPGPIALLGQSGNISSAIYRYARRLNVSFAYAINTGNEACLNVSDYLRHLADEPDVRGVLCYIEALRDGPGFIEAAKRLHRQGKLLALYKSGNSEAGAKAARSHTAAMAGNNAAYEAAFRAGGAVRAQSLSHLADLAYMHRFENKKIGTGIGVLTVSGAAGAIIADGLAEGGMKVPFLPDPVRDALQTFLPAFGSVSNPVDLTGNIANSGDALGNVLREFLLADCIDTVVMYLGDRSIERGLSYFAEIAAATDKFILIIDTFQSGLRKRVEDCGIAYFEDIDQALQALTSYHAWREMTLVEPISHAVNSEAILTAFEAATRAARNRQLSEVASKSILAAGGLKVAQTFVVHDRRSAVETAERIGYPVVLKLVSADIAHKTEIGGVRLSLGDQNAVAQAYSEIVAAASSKKPDARIEGVSVEPMVLGAQEILLGVVRDPVFGWMMTVGFGGTATELIGDVTHSLLPVDRLAALAMLQSLKTFPLLDGFRGLPKADLDAACAAIAALSAMVLCLDARIEECEVNPLLVLPQGRGAIAADALIALAPASLCDVYPGSTTNLATSIYTNRS